VNTTTTTKGSFMAENPTEILEPLPSATEAARTAMQASAAIVLASRAPPGAAEAATVTAAVASASAPATSAGLAIVGAWILAAGLLLSGVLANVLSFFAFWPKTAREAFSRVVVTMLMSVVAGPFVAVLTWNQYPGVFETAMLAAERVGLPGVYGLAMVAVNICCLTGMPGWYLLGMFMLVFERRKDKDLIEFAKEAKEVLP
jgi:hypothetical protein